MAESAILGFLRAGGNAITPQNFWKAYTLQTYWEEKKTGVFVSESRLYPGQFSEWSQEDLQYIIDNIGTFPKEALGDLISFNKKRHETALEKGFDYIVTLGQGAQIKAATGGSTYEIGILPTLKKIGDENKPGSLTLLEAVIQITRKGVTLTAEQRNIIGKYLYVHEKDLLKLIAFDEFGFKEFDLAVTKRMNEFLDTNPRIKGLVRAGATAVSGNWQWPEGGREEIAREVFAASKAEQSLVGNDAVNYRNPFENSLKEQENKVRLVEDKGFSNFKAGELTADAVLRIAGVWSLTITGDLLSSSQGRWAGFVLTLIQTLGEKDSSGKYAPPEIANIRELFERTINELLNFPVKVQVPVLNSVAATPTLPLREYVAKKILDVFRYTAWKSYAKDLKGKTKEQAAAMAATAKERAIKAFQEGEEAAKNSEAAVGGEPKEGEVLSQSEIEERQKFMKQCALMTRLPLLQREHLTTLSKTNNYKKRFYMVKDGDADQSGIMTKLLLPKGSSIKEFLDITPAVHAHLTPKLRFFKVFDGNSGVEQVEFKFRNFTSRKRVDDLKNVAFDKGGDYGIKEFSFSFQGTTPATAKNDIKANLSLYFQSFQDFIDKGFVDMLLLPGPSKAEPQQSKFHYSPRYYRIRADVGWTIDSINVKTLKSTLGDKRFKQLKDALVKTNKSFYLNMVDHTLDFKDDGSVQIDVEYRAYVETSAKGSKLDALASPEILKNRDKIRKDYGKILNSEKCTTKELSLIKAQLDQINELAIKNSFRSIMNRLIVNDAMYFKILKQTSENAFQKNGFFTEPVQFADEKSQPAKKAKQQEKAKKKDTMKVKEDSFTDLRNDRDFLYVNYFYLGDLLYVIMDTIYDNKGNYKSGFEKFKFILGSFEYQDFEGNNHVINLAQIPISAELFFEWFTENVLKPERQTYPILYFIRDLCNYLIGEILSENCFKKSIDKTMQFKTTNFVGIGDPISSIKGKIKDLSKEYGKTIPLAQDSDKQVQIKDFTNYIMIYVDTPKLKVKGDADYKRGKKDKDQDIGIYHYQIGKPHGLLKKLKFSKTDMQYIREARFFRNGYDGLMQLASVYKVSLDMIGNTLYYPGMEIYVNPLGFMGASNNAYNPTIGGENASVANKLGFGGYHLVTSVKSTIAPGKFTTQVEAMFNYSGDGDPSSTVIGSQETTKKRNVTEKTKAFQTGGYCTNVYNQIIGRALDVAGGGQYNSLDIRSAVSETNTNEIERAAGQSETSEQE